ncbi:hypothetical protein [Sessilibacter sp. MAH4]
MNSKKTIHVKTRGFEQRKTQTYSHALALAASDYNTDYKLALQFLALCLIAFSVCIYSTRGSAQEQTFVPDYLYPYSNMHAADIEGQGADRHFSAYGLTNEELEFSAANFFDNSLNTTQRLMNHQWIYQSYHDIELQSGSKFFSNLFKSTLKTYWQKYHQNKLINTALPDSSGEGSISEVNYKMRLKDDSVKMSFVYEF